MEHTTRYAERNNLNAVLNDMTALGWVYVSNSAEGDGYRLFFRRRKAESPSGTPPPDVSGATADMRRRIESLKGTSKQ